MISPLLRTTAWIALGSLLLLLLFSRLPVWNNPNTDLRAFVLESGQCDDVPCFLGVIPEETHYSEIGENLLQSPLVQAFDLVDREMQFRHVDWVWSGTQPAFMQRVGSVSIHNGYAEDIMLLPESTLLQAWEAFGAPRSIGGIFSTLLMRYPQHGFWIESQPDCSNPWGSRIEIHIRARMDTEPNERTLEERLSEICGRANWP